jgi:hypothetical protein
MFKAQLNDPVAASASSFIDQKKIGLRQRKSAPYKYKGLRTPQVRLLKLLPGRFGTSIHILFEFKSLIESSIPQYEALSYTWGQSDNPEDIYIGISEARVLSVTQSLACALQHLRHEDRPRTLWIDAICVDQTNLTERSSQVQRMADIYKLAERVLVWLGSEGDNSSYALEVLHSLGTKVDVDWMKSNMKPSDDAESNGETHWSELSVALPYKSEEVFPIYHLFQRSWFGRLWIRQEVGLANRAVIICGFDTIPWQNFRNAVFCLWYKDISTYCLGGPSEQQLFIDRLEMILHLCANTGSLSIPSLIEEARKCECSDPKDRIYGVLGLFNENDRALKIIPDYQKSIHQVYQDFFLSFLNTFKYSNLPLLLCCEMRDHRSTMPSWVPDFSQKKISNPFESRSASGSSAAVGEYTGEGRLKVLGVKVATIKDAEQIHMHGRNQSDGVALVRQYILPGVNTNGGELFDKYCRTLCGNSFRDRYDPPVAAFPSWYESKEVLWRLFERQEDVSLGKSLDLALNSYVTNVVASMDNRSFISTEAGHIGLAPLLAEAEDEVVVIPGCSSPMVLHPTDEGRHQVVGECFILGFMDGEALLGPLPEGYENITKLNEHNRWYKAYRDWRTDEVHWTDPRFNLFRSEMQENGIRRIFSRGSESGTESVNNECGVRMKTSRLPGAEEVIVMGVDLQPFELI